MQAPAPLNLNFSEDEKIGLTNQRTLRKLVGISGISLPILLWIFVWADTGYASPMQSISHYYFTRAGSIFCMIVSLLAIFLMVYKGKEPVDFYLSATAGIFALCVILFPTNNITDCCDGTKSYSVTFLKESNYRVSFHYIAAAVFLLCLAAMSLFIFTKSDKPPALRPPGKVNRNRIFRICGAIMIIAILVIFLGGFMGLIPQDFYEKNNFTFWMETIAIEAFGVSWLVKGKTK